MESTNANYDRDSLILVVDDDNTLLKFFKIHLNKFFSKVVVVKNAAEAMAVLKEKTFDLVISDVRMPRIDGVQLMRKIHNHDPSIPVYLISGAVIGEGKMDIIDEQADGFLSKPFEMDELHAFISDGIAKRQVFKELSEVMGNKDLKALRKGRVSYKTVSNSDIDRAEQLVEQIIKVS